MSEKGQGSSGGGQAASPGSGASDPPVAGDPKPTAGKGGGAQAPQKKPPNPNPPSGTIEFPDGGRLTGEGGKFSYTDPGGRTGEWKGDSWVDPGTGKPMPDDFRGRAPDPNRVRQGQDW